MTALTESLAHPGRPPAAHRDPVVFGPTPMVGLLDLPVRYDLAESTCPAVRVDEISGWGDIGRLSLGYGPSQGSDSLRRRIAEDHGVGPEDVILTAGSAGAMHLIAQDRCHGRTLLLTPCYPPARLVPEGLGSPVDEVRLEFTDGYRMPIHRIAAALTPETTLVSLASPQNPSGIRFRPDELADLLAVMADRSPDAFLLVDETYRASTYGTSTVPPSAATLSPRVVTCSSLSKAHGAPGLRLGWLVTTDPSLRERLRTAKFAGVVASPTIDEQLGDRLLADLDAILRPRATFLGERLTQLGCWAANHPIELLRPDGGALSVVCGCRSRTSRRPRSRRSTPSSAHETLAWRRARGSARTTGCSASASGTSTQMTSPRRSRGSQAR